ncbi:MAG TPA: class A beta-lactamase [Thermoanaerobaculia bacterium]|nr:class A beta-lactamase [Thermoanaerobaculia bacterium]
MPSPLLALVLSAPLLTTQPVPPLVSSFARLAEPAGGRVGVAVAILEERDEPLGWQSGYTYPMQSVYKLPIAMAALHEVEAGRLTLATEVRVAKADLAPAIARSVLRERHPEGGTVTVGELVRLAVADSDGTASDVLLRLLEGPEKVMAYLKDIGVREMTVADTVKEVARSNELQYRNSTTPDAAIQLLRALHAGPALAATHRTLLLRHMTETATAPRRLKGLLPPGTAVAHKSGTSLTTGGKTAATNDVGIVTLPDGRHLAIAVFIADSPADEATRERVIAEIARAAWDHYSAPPGR